METPPTGVCGSPSSHSERPGDALTLVPCLSRGKALHRPVRCPPFSVCDSGIGVTKLRRSACRGCGVMRGPIRSHEERPSKSWCASPPRRTQYPSDRFDAGATAWPSARMNCRSGSGCGPYVHKSIEMTLNLYAHVLPSMQADAANRLAALLHG